jgi:predicted NodU family carbamoyl transferase
MRILGLICNPRDALEVMEKSDIDGIILNDILIMRRVDK